MKTIDIVMPTGGSRGGVEYVINAWTKSAISNLYNLRVFHISPGPCDYLEGYEKQWTMPLSETGETKLDVEYCARCYGSFVSQYGPPDICIATWIPIVTSACKVVRTKGDYNFIILSWLHSEIDVYKKQGWGGLEHLAFADYHLCISKKTEKEIKSSYPDAKTFFIGNPIKMPHKENRVGDERLICFIGRISKEKRLDIILNAIASAKDNHWKLKIIGDGDEKEKMMGLAKTLEIDNRVDFTGWKDNPWDYVGASTVFIVASDYEGFCVTAHEASALGMTVITTPVNGCIDYIVPGKNGYYFDGSIKNLTEILDYISDGMLPLCDKNNCEDSVLPFMSDNYFLKLKKIFESICGG